jgi:hypothetical protein
VLDHMQQELEGSNCPSGLQHCVYRYVMELRDKRADKMLSALGITLFSLDVTPQFIPAKIFVPVEVSSYSLSLVT